MGSLTEFLLLAPGGTLLLTAAGILISEATYHGEKRRLSDAIAFLGFFAALLQSAVAFQWKGTSALSDSLLFDGSALLFQCLFLIGAIGALIVSRRGQGLKESDRAEYTAFLAIGTFFASWGTAAVDLLPMFLCLQFWLLGAVFFAGFRKDDARARKAAWAGYLFSVVSTAFFGIALALVFSQFGTLRLQEIESMGAFSGADPLFAQTVVLLFCLSLLVPLAAFPMMGWLGGIFDAAPAPAAMWLSWGGQALAFGMWTRLNGSLFHPLLGDGMAIHREILVGFAGATLLLGSAWALAHRRLRKVYGAFATLQGGYLLFGVIFPSVSSFAQSLYYLVVQWVAWVGLFIATEWIEAQLGSDHLSEGKKLGPTHWAEAAGLLFFLGSLAGIPPLPGFQSRFFLLSTSLQERNFTLLWIALFSSVFCLAVFGRVGFSLVGSIFQGAERETLSKQGERPRAWIILLAAVSVGLLASAHPILHWIQAALS